MRFLRLSLLLVLWLICGCTAEPVFEIYKGQLDLRSWQPDQHPRIALKGEWQLYRDHLLKPGQPLAAQASPQQVPASWNLGERPHNWAGQATYVLEVKLPEALLNQPLQLYTQRLGGYARFYANDQLIGQNGLQVEPGTSSESRVLSFVSFRPQSSALELRVLVDNALLQKGGLYQPVYLGKASEIARYSQRLQIYYLLCMGFALFLGFYHLILYLMRRRSMLLYFGILSLCGVLHIELFLAHIFEFSWMELPFEWNLRLIRSFICLAVPLALSFIQELFPAESTPRLTRSIWGINLLVCLLLGSLPLVWIHPLYQLLQIEIIVLHLYLARVLWQAWQQQRLGSRFFVLGGLIYLVLGIHDALYDLGLINSTYFDPLGIILIFFVQSLFLAEQFNLDFLRAAQLTEDLKQINLELEDRVQERTLDLQQKNEQLQGLIGFKEKVSHMIVHDLKDPLSVIISGLNMSGPRQEKLKQAMRLSAQRMLMLVQNLLDVQKLEEAKLEPQIQSLELDQVVQRSLQLFEPWLNTKVIQIELEIPADMQVQADPQLLERVLLNLFSNAFKHLSENGTLRVSAWQTQAGVQILVEDNGLGIPAELLKQIFEPFVSSERSVAHKLQLIPGTGLGLTFCKFALGLMQGSLQLESQLHQGTQVKISLPGPHNPLQTQQSSDQPAQTNEE